MKVFISWSGERSQSVAQSLRDWLPLILQTIEPWLSQSDIAAGDRWANEVAKELEASNFGVICITRDNVSSAWILFEAGALAKSMQEGRVIPLLFDLEFKDIAGPLAQFQAKKVEKSGLKDVIDSINRFCPNPIPDVRVVQLLDALWPQLENQLANVPKHGAPAKQNRPQHEVLEELVTSIRGLDLKFRETLDDVPRSVRRKRSRIHPAMFQEIVHRIAERPRDPIAILMAASLFRDEVPWLYELGVEAFRSRTREGSRSRELQVKFLRALRFFRDERGFAEELGLEPRDLHYMLREAEHILLRFDHDLDRGPSLELKTEGAAEPE